MDAGSPEPAMHQDGDTSWVAYRCANPDFPGWGTGAAPDHPGFDEYHAAIKFSGVSSIALGPPSDDRLHEHPLYGLGLEPYEFHRVEGSAAVADPANASHWIITFHDETLEVIAEKAEVVVPRIDAPNPKEALRRARSPSAS